LNHYLKKGEPALILAPMEGVTDFPMRALLTELGGFSFCISEFIRVTQEILPEKVLHRFIPELKNGGKTDSGCPVFAQILGGNPWRMAETARSLVSQGALGIDINFGCPAPIVNRNDGGAVILKEPHRIKEIIKSVRSSVPSDIPVSAKVRLGWENPTEIYRISEAVIEGGASWLTIHARTRSQGYAKPVHWELIGEIRKNFPIPVIANGDIWSLEDFRKCREVTGCEHFMLGRGALGEPTLALQICRELGISSKTTAQLEEYADFRERWVPLFKRFVELGEPQAISPHYTVRRIKQWLNLASRTRDITWAEPIKRATNLAEIWEAF